MSSLLQKNEGTSDRTIRVIAGVAILSQVFMGLHTPWAWIGIVPLVTGAVGMCPLYSLFGFNTCSMRNA